YSQYSAERTSELLSLARAAGLPVTGGSDFHGDAKPHIRLGQVDQGQPAPDALLFALKEARSRNKQEQLPKCFASLLSITTSTTTMPTNSCRLCGALSQTKIRTSSRLGNPIR